LVPADTFLYSVFDVDDSDAGYLIYRARLDERFSTQEIPDALRFFSARVVREPGVLFGPFWMSCKPRQHLFIWFPS
jgi:hypothetical protein